MNKKATFQLSVSFIVIMIISIAIFASSVYMVKRFFTQAEIIKMTYDDRAEQEIERLLDDGSRIAIPFDQKRIPNGEFETFGIGVLNVLNTDPSNDFRIDIKFKKAFDRKNIQICTSGCGPPNTWLQTTGGQGGSSGVSITKTIRNNDQEKFLLGVGVKDALKGTYIFDMNVTYREGVDWVSYDNIHKLYVEVP